MGQEADSGRETEGRGAEGLRIFDGAVAVVTGAASGIGEALARELARRGATVVLADRQAEEAAVVAASINAAAGASSGDATAESVELDVRDAEVFDRVLADTVARHGRVDYLFNNAGIGIGGPALAHTTEDWRYMIDVNLMGVVHGIQAAYPRMVEQGFGHIVNTASIAGLTACPGLVSYAAAKHAVVGITRALRVEAAEHGVRVGAFCPGFIRTPILEGGRYGRMLGGETGMLSEEVKAKLGGMEPADFAPRALNLVAVNREIMVLPWQWKVLWWLDRLLPGLVTGLTRRQLRRMLADAA